MSFQFACIYKDSKTKTNEGSMNLEYSKAIGGAVLVASAAILLSGCTINIGAGSTEAEANDSVTGANSSQTIEYAADGTGDSNGGADNHPEGGYLPELGESAVVGNPSDVFNPCTEVSGEFYESLGMSELKAVIENESTPSCSLTLEGNGKLSISALFVGLEFLEGDETMGWSETSDRIPIGLIDNSYGGAPSCSATVGTERGTLMVSHEAPNSDGDACAQAEHYLRTILTADGKDNYNG
ncbi:hypothetical protein AALI21_06200 [Corynebacteriaceae bacterium 6-324]